MKFSTQFLTALYRFRDYNKLIKNSAGKVIWYFVVITAICFCIRGVNLAYSYYSVGGISGLANTYLPEFKIENGKLDCKEYKFSDSVSGLNIVVNTSPDFVASEKMAEGNTFSIIADSNRLLVVNPMEYQEIKFDDELLQGLDKAKIVKFFKTSILIKLMLICACFMAFGGFLINYMLYVMFEVCIGNLVNSFVKAQVHFRSIIKLGVYVMTFPSLLSAVSSSIVMATGHNGNTDFNLLLFTALGGVYMYLALKNIKASNGYVVATL